MRKPFTVNDVILWVVVAFWIVLLPPVMGEVRAALQIAVFGEFNAPVGSLAQVYERGPGDTLVPVFQAVTGAAGGPGGQIFYVGYEVNQYAIAQGRPPTDNYQVQIAGSLVGIYKLGSVGAMYYGAAGASGYVSNNAVFDPYYGSHLEDMVADATLNAGVDRDLDGDVDAQDYKVAAGRFSGPDAAAKEAKYEELKDDEFWEDHLGLLHSAVDYGLHDWDEDGDIDAFDVMRNVDLDGDGLVGSADLDTDGDHEPDRVEAVLSGRSEETGAPSWFDSTRWPDRDEDGLADWADPDGDGWANIFERMYGRVGGGQGTDPHDETSHPGVATSEEFNGSEAYGFRDNRPWSDTYGQNMIVNDWGDDDGDGAPNWLEDYYSSSPSGSAGALASGARSDPASFPDGDGDGIWDFGKGYGPSVNGPITLDASMKIPEANQPTPIVIAPSVPGSTSNTNPFPMTAPDPGNASSAGSVALPSVPEPTTAGGAAPSVPVRVLESYEKPTVTNTSTNTVSPPNSYQTSVPNIPTANPTSNPGTGGGYTTNGSTPTGPGGSGSGSGGGGGGGGSSGGGNYREVDVPRGVSSNWEGAGGGTWKQTASPNIGQDIAGAVDQYRGTLANLFPSGLQSYGTASHVIVFNLPKPGGGSIHVEIPALPDTSTPVGAALEVGRTFLRLVCAVVSGWAFIIRVFTALRQW